MNNILYKLAVSELSYFRIVNIDKLANKKDIVVELGIIF